MQAIKRLKRAIRKAFRAQRKYTQKPKTHYLQLHPFITHKSEARKRLRKLRRKARRPL